MTNHSLKTLLAAGCILSSLTLPAFAEATWGSKSVDRWVQKLEWKVDRHMNYPTRAAMSKQQGMVQMRVRFEPDGELASAQIIESSGYQLLDNAALKLATRFDNLPPPPMLNGKQIKSVRFHLTYSLAPDYNRLSGWADAIRAQKSRTKINDLDKSASNGQMTMVLETSDFDDDDK